MARDRERVMKGSEWRLGVAQVIAYQQLAQNSHPRAMPAGNIRESAKKRFKKALDRVALILFNYSNSVV
jgi:hypothetical protein